MKDYSNLHVWLVTSRMPNPNIKSLLPTTAFMGELWVLFLQRLPRSIELVLNRSFHSLTLFPSMTLKLLTKQSIRKPLPSWSNRFREKVVFMRQKIISFKNSLLFVPLEKFYFFWMKYRQESEGLVSFLAFKNLAFFRML